LDFAASSDRVYGVHGYNNRDLPMHPFFMARGPAFKPGNYSIFDNIDLLSMICHIIEIDTPPNNGTFAHVEQMLASKHGSLAPMSVIWAVGKL